MKTATKMWVSTALVWVSGCNLASQATSKTVAISTVLSTPAVEVKAGALAGNGLDAGLTLPDAGFAFDAGALLDAGVLVPRLDLAYVFFGQRQSESLDVAPQGLPGATVTLEQVGGRSWSLADQGGGSYALGPDAGFTYQNGATYDFSMTLAGVTYVAEVAQVPDHEEIAAFHPAGGYVSLAAGSSFTFTRPDPPLGQGRPLGFVNVFPVALDGTRGAPTYTNVPQTPLEFLKLVVAPSDWQRTLVTIPGSAFPQTDRNYVIVMQAAKLGGPKSANLFTGSAVLAGTADLAIVKTGP